jgi:hypothetical protein
LNEIRSLFDPKVTLLEFFNYKHRSQSEAGLEAAERKKRQKNPNLQLRRLEMTADLELFSTVLQEGSSRELADEISSVADDYLIDSETFNLTLIGLEEMCALLQHLLATLHQDPATAADSGLQWLYRAATLS